MRSTTRISKPLKTAAFAACLTPFLLGSAWAGECPGDKTRPEGLKPGPTAPSGVTDTVIASIDLGPLGTGLEGRALRMRKLVVQPGGIVPWHSHETRPANIYIISGSIPEYRSTCSVPIQHKAGDVTAEFG